MSESSDEDSCVKLEELRHRESAELSFLPERSRKIYIKAYELFNNWRLSKGAKTYSESVLLSYFMDLAERRQPSTLWSVYSMLKAVIKAKNNVHIERYPKLLAFLKRRSEGFKSKKSKVFTAPEVDRFLKEAPDYSFLDLKVVLIIGLSGACRFKELINLTLNDIEMHSDKLILVKLLFPKTKTDRSFVIREEYVSIVQKYIALRPAHATTNRFFLQYNNGKCSTQPMGKNKIGETPRKIATFLNLDDPHLYTGHCLRRTSATLCTDSGADLTILKRYGGWEPTTYVEVPII